MQKKRAIKLWIAGVISATLAFVMSLLLFHFQPDSYVRPTLAKTQTVNFSMEPVQLLSPDREYVIENEGPNWLMLRKIGSSERVHIRDYFRNVDISWAPDSKLFALTERWGSNGAEPYIYKLEDLTKPLSLEERLLELDKPLSLSDSLLASDIAPEDKEVIFNDDHSYISVEHWYGSRQLLVKASGHFSRPDKLQEYTFLYSLDLGTNKWKLLKRMDFES